MLASLGLIFFFFNFFLQLILFFKPHFYSNETQYTFNAFSAGRTQIPSITSKQKRNKT